MFTGTRTPLQIRTRRVSSYEFACFAAEWRRDGANVLDAVTYDAAGYMQRHVIAPGDGIHAIYTITDVSPCALSAHENLLFWRSYAFHCE